MHSPLSSYVSTTSAPAVFTANACMHVADYYRAKGRAAEAVAPAGYLARFYRAAAVGFLFLAIGKR